MQQQPTVNGKAGYLDPFSVDRQDYFDLGGDGSLKPRKIPAEYMISSLALNRPFLRYIRRRRDLIYNALLTLERHFQTEIQAFRIVLADETLSDLEKARWAQEKKHFEAFLELIIALDEALSLPNQDA